MNAQPNLNVPRRIPELWFEDGNIVLQAGNVQYRVFRSILARHSPVFRDMLSFPQPADGEVVDGCPLVRIPDPEEETTPFLSALFDIEYFPPFPALTTALKLYGCLRLSHKYEVLELRKRALIHLSSRFRTELQQHNRVRLRTSSLSDLSHPVSNYSSWAMSSDDDFLICLVQLAREVDALWVLPHLFYQLVVGGLRRAVYNGVQFGGIAGDLSPQDQINVEIALHSHTSASLEIFHCLQTPGPALRSACPSSKDCLDRCLRVVSSNQWMLHEYLRDPLTIWADGDWAAFDELGPKPHICRICLTDLMSRVKAIEEGFWTALPGLHGLPPWNQLNEMKKAAIGDEFL
ncbi:BTB domain-containing protein [Mycena indigotica]|uniref:BTB domain-containing protein n=1 Tax=Mycena indigotica TaxID=2126181 RepID=A0A8H6TCJ2_9AGAR|nr:BTB domain-containing protein [Mycena indigotica]KAF7314946.1 BTB domain-containing protein [Mycena indigotica]